LPKSDNWLHFRTLDGPEYTRRTIEERTRVEKQLDEGYRNLTLAVQFDYQGSVTNDTHIRAHSDVDLLTVPPQLLAVYSHLVHEDWPSQCSGRSRSEFKT